MNLLFILRLTLDLIKSLWMLASQMILEVGCDPGVQRDLAVSALGSIRQLLRCGMRDSDLIVMFMNCRTSRP